MMKAKLNILKSPEDTVINLASLFVTLSAQAISNTGRFSIALSGGSSPKKLYELLASDAYKNKVEWEKVYFFFGDERYVPHTDKDSNYLMAKIALFDPLKISHSNIFAVDTSKSPEGAAEDYTAKIDKFFGHDPKSFDLILLGLGDNSHTASLFPGTPVLHDTTESVKEVYLTDQQVYRITFTAPLINEAHHIAFLVYGEGKAEAVHHVLEDDRDIETYPAQLIAPTHGDVIWYLDDAAAAKVSHRF
jgi:6-phosphogluconolactonase